MNLWKSSPLLLITLLLAGCNSPFEPAFIAPKSIPTIASPAELPKDLSEKTLLWYGGALNFDTGNMVSTYPEDSIGEMRLSSDGRYLTYVSHNLISENGLPGVGDYIIKVIDLQSQDEQILVSKDNSFPDAQFLTAPTFTSDGKWVVFVVAGGNDLGLARVNINNKELQLLDVDTMLVNFVKPDVSRNGSIVVICKGPDKENLAAELCLLDASGKFVRYLTSEGYQVPGYGLFTPDGKQVIYESRGKLYKINVDGSGRQLIAPCSILGPSLVTEEHAVIACYLSLKPDCYGSFIAGLDGKDFRRIDYIEPYCVPEKQER